MLLHKTLLSKYRTITHKKKQVTKQFRRYVIVCYPATMLADRGGLLVDEQQFQLQRVSSLMNVVMQHKSLPRKLTPLIEKQATTVTSLNISKQDENKYVLFFWVYALSFYMPVTFSQKELSTGSNTSPTK